MIDSLRKYADSVSIFLGSGSILIRCSYSYDLLCRVQVNTGYGYATLLEEDLFASLVVGFARHGASDRARCETPYCVFLKVRDILREAL